MEVLLACFVVGTLMVAEYGHASDQPFIQGLATSLLVLVAAVGGACII